MISDWLSRRICVINYVITREQLLYAILKAQTHWKRLMRVFWSTPVLDGATLTKSVMRRVRLPWRLFSNFILILKRQMKNQQPKLLFLQPKKEIVSCERQHGGRASRKERTKQWLREIKRHFLIVSWQSCSKAQINKHQKLNRWFTVERRSWFHFPPLHFCFWFSQTNAAVNT